MCIVSVAEGVMPPEVVSLTPTSVQLSWVEPQLPNGVIVEYVIERRYNVTEPVVTVATISPSDDKVFIDDSRELSPYTVYEYRLVVVNVIGRGESAWTDVTTQSSSK
jgi:hypothetical protein